MNYTEKIKMFQDVFAPKSGEKVLFLVDVPDNNIKDNEIWKDRRNMAQEWYTIFREMGTKARFSVDWLEYKATGVHNSPIPLETLDMAQKSNLVLAMTEYSASSSLVPITKIKNANIRVASMPLVEKRMEETAFKANYKEVQKYAAALHRMLNNALTARVVFSTGDTLFIDLRNRNAFSEAGDCTKKGQFINFPSGEACMTPYEAEKDEIKEFGPSKTEGIWPVRDDGELIKYSVKQNKIVEIIGVGKKAEEMRLFFKENDTRRNIAELGIGCNPKAVVTGNGLEDEKVGLHIAYGMSTHIGGKIKSDTHFDIVYAKNCPVEGTTLTLINKDGSVTELIKDAMLRYDLLK
jgi:aminopeptidase